MAFPSYSNIKKLGKLPLSSDKDKTATLTPKLHLRNGSTIRQSLNSFSLQKNHTPINSVASSMDFEELSENSTIDLEFYQSEYGLRRFCSSNKEVFIRRVLKGPPKIFRWITWLICAQLPSVRDKVEYLNLLEAEVTSEIQLQIEKDISRTLSEGYDFFKSEDAQNSLYRLLKSIAALDPELGYCQGMNFVGGFILAMCDFEEVDSFFLFSSVLSISYSNKFCIRGFFLDGFPLLSCYLYVFNNCFKTELPELYKHFKMLEIPDETWVSKWFQTLFTICLPPTLCSRLWDCLFVEGKLFLIKFAIALLRFLQSKLFELDDVVDLADFFKRMNPYTMKKGEKAVDMKGETVIKMALKENLKKEPVDFHG